MVEGKDEYLLHTENMNSVTVTIVALNFSIQIDQES